MERIETQEQYDAEKLRLSRLKICRWITPEMKDIERALLEYRRANGIFEVDDFVILPYDDDEESLQKIISINDKHGLYEYSNGCCGYGKNIRHATPEEIAAGHRL